jgi:hypothetical protein
MPALAQAPNIGRDTMRMAPSPFGIPMDRAGSGTTWIPDAVRVPSRHFMAGGWDMMLHGFVFGQLDAQSGARGETQVGSLNWGMFMASHELAGGRVQPRAMLSLDPWTITSRGYPLLLQTGETFRGEPLHDRQHPHDFLMELGVSYERAVTRSVGLQLYGAPSGEPALGPVAFMHRPSAMDNPSAPLGHHWQDATHVSFGVFTVGLFGRRWKLEGSAFNGREPDENRWNLEPMRLDSYAGRFTLNPDGAWSLSASYGYLASPEAREPRESIHRIEASAMHGASFGRDGQWSSSIVFGANTHSGTHDIAPSWLAETELLVDASNTLFARAERVEKNAAELAVDTAAPGFASDRRFRVGALTVGAIHELLEVHGGTFGLGASGTLNVVPAELRSLYGSRAPLGAMVFVRLRPAIRNQHADASHRMPMGTHEASGGDPIQQPHNAAAGRRPERVIRGHQ